MSLATLPLPDRNTLVFDDDPLEFDVVDGYRVERNMGNRANLAASLINFRLFEHVHPRKLGFVGHELVIRLKPGAAPRRPDILFVATEHFLLADGPDRDPWEIVPDLCIEVLSPSNTFEKIEEKLIEYFAAGVRQVWVVSPRARRVSVYSSPKDVKIYDQTDEFEAAPVLPGLKLRVADLFPQI